MAGYRAAGDVARTIKEGNWIAITYGVGLSGHLWASYRHDSRRRETVSCTTTERRTSMGRMNRTLGLLFLVGVALLWAVPPVPAEEGAPQPDGSFQMMTTSIAPDMGVSWADGQLSFKFQNYNFGVEGRTMAEETSMTSLGGEQITLQGMVYNLKNVSDFSGTYTRVKPEEIKAMGSFGSDHVFKNDKDVVLRVTKRLDATEDMHVRLLGKSFKVTLKAF
jgi:hypothetical protein